MRYADAIAQSPSAAGLIWLAAFAIMIALACYLAFKEPPMSA